MQCVWLRAGMGVLRSCQKKRFATVRTVRTVRADRAAVQFFTRRTPTDLLLPTSRACPVFTTASYFRPCDSVPYILHGSPDQILTSEMNGTATSPEMPASSYGIYRTHPTHNDGETHAGVRTASEMVPGHLQHRRMSYVRLQLAHVAAIRGAGAFGLQSVQRLAENRRDGRGIAQW